MASHYDVLGVQPSASPGEIRQAYHDQARRFHPDGYTGRPIEELRHARRAMQDVNEAWRVLRDPGSRASYDRELRSASTPPRAEPAPAYGDEWMDRPYPRRAAEPGDVTLAIVRAVPWIAVLAVLAAVFVFTAYARNGDDEDGLLGRCITIENARATETPCAEPNDGRVVGIVRQENLCTGGTTARVVAGGEWYCLRPAGSG